MSDPANTILLSPANAMQTVREKLAGGVIIPGHLVEVTAADTFVVHNTAAANAQKVFALENVADASGIDDAYVSGETVRSLYPARGDEINALVAASAPAIVIGDALESAGDGTVRKAVADAATDTTQRDSIVGYANVAVDNSGGGAAVRIKLEVA